MGTKEQFLEAMGAFLAGEQVNWAAGSVNWPELLQKALAQNVLPMVFETVYACPAFQELGREAGRYRQGVMQQVMVQTMKTQSFLALYSKLLEAGVTPLVVKGLICRCRYPKPDHRISGDEDVVIPREQFARCHQVFLEFGLAQVEPDRDLEAAGEVPYQQKGGPLYIELHKELFPAQSEAYGELNRIFDGAFDRKITEEIQGVPVYTMGHTDHLLYLICHAFKHFLHSGFGIRQVCDLVCYANEFGSQVDWDHVLEACRNIRAERFAAALFQIGEEWLRFDSERACYPATWRELEVDSGPLLEDLISGGVYGAADMARQHSSTITLNAVAAQKQGKKGRTSILRTVFPPREALKGRYPYLERHPALLPVAWGQRILKYRRETKKDSGQAAESIRIGSQRVELLKEYHIID